MAIAAELLLGGSERDAPPKVSFERHYPQGMQTSLEVPIAGACLKDYYSEVS